MHPLQEDRASIHSPHDISCRGLGKNREPLSPPLNGLATGSSEWVFLVKSCGIHLARVQVKSAKLARAQSQGGSFMDCRICGRYLNSQQTNKAAVGGYKKAAQRSAVEKAGFHALKDLVWIHDTDVYGDGCCKPDRYGILSYLPPLKSSYPICSCGSSEVAWHSLRFSAGLALSATRGKLSSLQ